MKAITHHVLYKLLSLALAFALLFGISGKSL